MPESVQLSSVLFNAKRMKVLEVLLDSPDSSYTVSELVEISGVSKPTVIDFIDKLDRLGVVDRKKHGNAYLISLNRGSDYIDPLKGLLELDTKPLIESARHLEQELVEDLGENIVSIVLYGSVARGTPTVDSDIDILVVTDGEDATVENRIQAVATEMGEMKGLRFSPLVMTREEIVERVETGDSFIKTVMEEGEVLYGESEWFEIRQKTH